jgi:squalene synthase HpnC
MIDSAQLRSGKGSRDENFPVASWLVRRQHRPAILAFYEFVRVADDIADHPALGAAEKLARLDSMEAGLLGDGGESSAAALRVALAERGLTPRHARDLLSAFRQDVTKLRYKNWDDLVDYCARSAMPVGRFVLDVHGEPRSTWPASDALCAALQIINHLQDCAADYRNLDRVYLPLDGFAARGIGVAEFAGRRASPALRDYLAVLTARTAALLEMSSGLDAAVNDPRLGLEISVIQTMAARLIAILRRRDPLSEPVHLGRVGTAAFAIRGVATGLLRRLRPAATPKARESKP